MSYIFQIPRGFPLARLALFNFIILQIDCIFYEIFFNLIRLIYNDNCSRWSTER